MHVLHIIDTLGLGGAERMLVDIANATVADGHRVSVCVTRSDQTLAPELDQRIELFVLSRRRRFELMPLLRLARWIRRHDVDLVHVHMRHTLSFVLALRASRMISAPLVFHDHYGTIEIDKETPTWFRFGHRFVDHYVGVYAQLSEWAQRAGIPASKTTTIPNALALDRLETHARCDIRRELGISPDLCLGVMVATVRPDKGIETLIDALAVSTHRAALHIVIAGSVGDVAYAKRCNEQIRRNNLQSQITFLGGRTDVPALLRCCDFGLLSSHTESGPLVLIEYLAAGLPIVSTSVGDIGRRLEALGVAGFVRPRDPVKFAISLDELLAVSSVQRRDRGERGKQLLSANWDIRAAMPKWYAVYSAARVGR